MTSPEPAPALALELLGGLTVRQAQAKRTRVLELGAHYRQAIGVGLYLEPELAGRLAYERGTRTIDEVRRELPPAPAELTLVEALDRARVALGFGVGTDQPVPGLDVPASEETAEGVVHSAESEGRPASPLEGTPPRLVPIRPQACNAAGSLGRHPIPAGAPASCPCGRVRRFPPA